MSSHLLKTMKRMFRFDDAEVWNCCGCCGREIAAIQEWCNDCSKHVLDSGPPWDRTYFARYGRECPFATPPDDGGSQKAA